MSKVNVQVFTDFDGTLSLDDTGILLIDDHRSLGSKRRRVLEEEIMEGTKTYRDALQEMWENVHISWEEACEEHLDTCRVDPGFPGFYKYCVEHNFPVTVVSSGLYPVVSRVLRNLLGKEAEKDIKLICNGGQIKDRSWEIKWHDDTIYGNDKSLTLKEARKNAEQDTIFVFCGDGVSDISAARHADVLFARKGRDLVVYCKKENIPFEEFESFEDVQNIVQKLVEGKAKLEKNGMTGFSKVVDC